MLDSNASTTAVPGSGHPDRQCLQDFARGRLSPDELERCAGHLEACPSCQQYVLTTPDDRLMTLVRQAVLVHGHSGPKHLLQKYEIIEEIGRGGMAVVYKARQIGLNRFVALKQIKADVITAEGVTRFRAEAGAMARVQHPNIVQVYDVGEQEGRPYLACEFLAGGSLERHLAGTPLPTRVACRLVATLARALQVAHEHSVIHRDLKPSNVLLSPGDEDTVPGSERFWEVVVPKIGDFGLAKHLDKLQGQTQSGAVMGTPGYMAPEQASGRVQQVGAGTDVFALGVMLYELLTGRRPFQAPTVVQTLDLICSAEPLPPRRWKPSLQRDLDVICLKCLEKDVARRYRRADELADDLERFLAGAPILARSASGWERGCKWVRRHPAISGLLTTIAVAVLTLFGGLFWHNNRLAHEVQRANANEAAALAAHRKGYDAIYELLNELMEDQTDTEIADHRLERLSEITRAYHADTLKGTDDANPEVRFARASSRFFVGAAHEMNGQPEVALPLLASARQELEELEGQVRDRVEFNSRLAACCRRLALARFNALNAADAVALENMRRATRILKELIQSQPGNVNFYRRQSGALHELATLYVVAGQTSVAEDVALESLGVLQSLERFSSLGVLDRVSCERTISFLGRLRSNQGRFGEAEAILLKGEAMLLNNAASHSSAVDAALADLYDARCQLEQDRGRTLQALQERNRSVELLHKLLADVPRHRFARRVLPAYEMSRKELLSRLMRGDATGTAELAQEISRSAAQVSEVRLLRINRRSDEAAAQLAEIEPRLLDLRKTSDSMVLARLLADANFEWAELHIACGRLDDALPRYDRCISFLKEPTGEAEDRSSVAELLANCYRLKAWHLSRAGQSEAAFAAWDLAVANAAGPTRDYLRAERALERAMLNDHAGAIAEADQVTAEGSLEAGTLLHLARVYSVALGAILADARLNTESRQQLADYCADRGVGCLRRLSHEFNADGSLLRSLDTDHLLGELRKNASFDSWRRQIIE